MAKDEDAAADEVASPILQLPKECLERVAAVHGAHTAARCSTVCKAWRGDLGDDVFWRSLHQQDYGPRPLRHCSYRRSLALHAGAAANWAIGRAPRRDCWPGAHERWVTALDLTPTHVLTGSMDTTLKLWERSTGNWLHFYRGNGAAVMAVKLLGGGAAASGGRDGTLRWWDLETGACTTVVEVEGGRQWVNSLAVWRGPTSGGAQSEDAAATSSTSHPDRGRSVVCGTSIGQLLMFDARRGNGAATRFVPPLFATGAIYSVATEGNNLAASCANGSIYVWDVRAARVRRTLVSGPRPGQTTLSHTSIDMRCDALVGGDFGGGLHVWDIGDVSPPRVGGDASPSSSAPHAAASGAHAPSEPPPLIGSPGSVSPLCSAAHVEWVRAVALQGDDGRHVISSSKDGHVRLSRRDTLATVREWDLNAGTPEAGGGGAVGGTGADGEGNNRVNQAFCLAADRWGFVAGCQDNSIRSWYFAPGGVLPEEAAAAEQ